MSKIKVLYAIHDGEESLDFYDDGTIEIETAPQNLGCHGFMQLKSADAKNLYQAMKKCFADEPKSPWMIVDTPEPGDWYFVRNKGLSDEEWAPMYLNADSNWVVRNYFVPLSELGPAELDIMLMPRPPRSEQ